MPGLSSAEVVGQGWQLLRRQPRLLLGFSALGCGLQGLGWQLFALGHRLESGVQAFVVHGLGLALHLGSLAWLIDGLSRAALSLSDGRLSSWARIGRWHGRRSWWLALGLLNAGLSAAALALAGFIVGSLLLQLIEALGLAGTLGQQVLVNLIPYPCSLLGAAVALLSQLFNPHLVIAERLSPSRAYHEGWRLLNLQGPALMGTLVPLAAIALSPFLLLLLLQAALTMAGLELGTLAAQLVFWLAILAILPLLACCLAAAYRQIRPAAR